MKPYNPKKKGIVSHIDIFLLCIFELCVFTLCSSQTESINEAKDIYQKLIALNESFQQKIMNVKEKKEAQIIIERFIADRDRLLSGVDKIEKKYPDFRQNHDLQEFEKTLEKKTRETVDSGIDSLQNIVPVNNLKELADVMNKSIPEILSKQSDQRLP